MLKVIKLLKGTFGLYAMEGIVLFYRSANKFWIVLLIKAWGYVRVALLPRNEQITSLLNNNQIPKRNGLRNSMLPSES